MTKQFCDVSSNFGSRRLRLSTIRNTKKLRIFFEITRNLELNFFLQKMVTEIRERAKNIRKMFCWKPNLVHFTSQLTKELNSNHAMVSRALKKIRKNYNGQEIFILFSSSPWFYLFRVVYSPASYPLPIQQQCLCFIKVFLHYTQYLLSKIRDHFR